MAQGTIGRAALVQGSARSSFARGAGAPSAAPFAALSSAAPTRRFTVPVARKTAAPPAKTQRGKASSSPAEPDAKQLRRDRNWGLWWQLPVPATSQRPTVRAELVKGQVWGFDQLQGTLKIFINTRMTVVALSGGGLFVNNPVAPTRECVNLLRELEDVYGPVKIIALSSAALEHKSYLKPFANRFPDAEVWAAPGQWSFPVNIPLAAGLWPTKITGEIADSGTPEGDAAPWADDLEVRVLGVGGSVYTGFEDPWFVDVAWYHKRSKTLLVTDSVLQVPLDPVPVCEIDPEPLLLRTADEAGQGAAEDTPANRRKGWWKVCLFATFVAPSKQSQAYVGFDGFTWEEGWEASFTSFANRLIVHPILRVLCFNRRPEEVLAWADDVASWDIRRVVPAHFEAPIRASGKDFRRAFNFLEEGSGAAAAASSPPSAPLSGARGLLGGLLGGAGAAAAGLGDPSFSEEDLSYLRGLDADTVKQGTSEPAKVYTGSD